MKSVYLCGPILGRSDGECVTWRQTATKLLNPIPTLDPIRRDYRGRELEPGVPAEIVAHDEEDIRNSACLLVMFDKPSVGTSMEIRMAAKEFKIPVFVVDISGSVRSPWLIHHTTQFFPDLVSACNHIQSDWKLWPQGNPLR